MAWMLGLIIALLGSGGHADAQTEIVVRNLLGEQAITDPLPVRVELRQRGASTRGTLEWWSEPNLRYRLPVELPAGARKTVHLALPLNAWDRSRRSTGSGFRLPMLIWRSDAGDLRVLSVPFAWNNRLPVVVIGDVQGGFERWRQAAFALEYRFSSMEVRSGNWALEPVYWSPAHVPAEWQVLLGIPLIILTEGSERLSSEQWDALLAWLLAGGHLIVSVGSIGTPLKGTPLAPLLPSLGKREPVRLTEPVIATAPLPSASARHGSLPPSIAEASRRRFASSPQESRLPIAVIRSSGWDDATIVAYSGGGLIACSRRVGRGTLTLCFSDMTARAWREWQGYESLINQWVAMLELPLLSIQTPFERRSLRPPIERAHVLGATAIFALYWLALYLSWRILRRRRLLIRAPLVLLLLAGLTWLALAWVAPSSVDQVHGRSVRLFLGDRHLPVMLEHHSYHLVLPAGEHRLRWESGMQLLAERRQTLLSNRLMVEYEADTDMLFQPFGASEVQLQLVRLLKLPAPVSVVQREGRYTVRNPLPYPLHQVQIRRAPARGVRPGAFELVRDLPAGMSVSAKPQHMLAIYGVLPREGEWLTAIINNTPSPLQTPLTIQEDATTLWVRIR